MGEARGAVEEATDGSLDQDKARSGRPTSASQTGPIPGPALQAAPAEAEELLASLNLAHILCSRGKPLEALALMERALARSPSDLGLLHFKGRCLEAANNVPGVSA
jgi:hypothetical protein